MQNIPDGVSIVGKVTPGFAQILTNDAVEFVAGLHREFNQTRKMLLQRRIERQSRLDTGSLPDFLPETQDIRHREWKVAFAPRDLEDRRVEITGPVERKMMINALNSGANVFMADFEDSLSPTWSNVVQGQINLMDAVRRTLTYVSPEGKLYQLKEKIATLLVRPRGWHLEEKHVVVDGEPISASLFDFGLYFFHNARESIQRGTGPYFYIPKLESHLEARLWNRVFEVAQETLGIPRGTVRATVLIETILAAFEMDEILYELKDHASGLNAGRWDYIFSLIKKFSKRPDLILPDRAQVTMTVPFMRAYTELLVKTCHSRGAHAIGGMSAFVPSRKDARINEVAFTQVRRDKEREATQGFDGTWVAHPDLVQVAKEVFDKILGENLHQKHRLREEVNVTSKDLVDLRVHEGEITEVGLRNNVSVALQYMENWLREVGAVTIYNLMEDAATAEITRAQIWQWIRNGARLKDGRVITVDLYKSVCEDEISKLGGYSSGRYRDVIEILDRLILSETFPQFLTIPAYEYFD